MSPDLPPAWTAFAHRIGWAASLVLVLLLLSSAFWSDRIPVSLKVSVALVALLAIRNPGEALLLLGGLMLFGHLLTTRVFGAYPFGLVEAWLLAFFFGYLWHERRRAFDDAVAADSLALSSRLFVAVVLASCVVQLTVLQAYHDYPLSYTIGFFRFLATEYLTTLTDPRPWVDGRSFASVAALLVEGVALLQCVRTLCQRQPVLAQRLTNVVAMAGVGAAVLSFGEVLAFAYETNQSMSEVIRTGRWASAIPSINSSGSYFMLVAFVAMGNATLRSRGGWWRVAYLGASVILFGAMWLTKTRAAVVSAIATAFGALIWWIALRARASSPRRVLILSGLAAFVAAVGMIVYNPFSVMAPGADASLRYRFLFAQTALRMFASQPLFGVGVGQYGMHYPAFSSAELLEDYAGNDAHNYFLWIAAELGLVGLIAFLAVVVPVLLAGWRRFHAAQTEWQFRGLYAGLVAFAVTWISGQPLSVPQVAYTFWIGLGAMLSMGGAPARASVTDRKVDAVLHTRYALLVVVAALVIVGSVPIRAARARQLIDLSRVTYGFYGWDAFAGARYRWTSGRATFFVRSSTDAIELPVRANPAAAPEGFHLDIAVNGVTTERMTVKGTEWQFVRLDAPEHDGLFWRVDLRIAPTWVPRAVLSDSSDARELGIMVGEITVLADDRS